jgi:hypothetical protein
MLSVPAGWRDPFVLEKPSAASPWWYVMVGAGVRSRCGTAMVYRSLSLTEGERVWCWRGGERGGKSSSATRLVPAPVCGCLQSCCWLVSGRHCRA